MKKNLICALFILLFASFVNSPEAFSKSRFILNRIEGRVYDPNRMPVEKAEVELLNDVDSMVGHTRTDTTGRFTFTGMPAGRYNIKVLPLGTNLLEQTQEAQVTQSTLMGNDVVYIDFYLRFDKRGSATGAAISREVLFVQEVPVAAKKLFDEGLSELTKNQDKGLAKLEEAIKIFPNYFDAQHWLGKIYVSLKMYEKGYPYLIKAIDINPKSYSSYYNLGFAFYQIRQYPAATEAAKAATVLSADSIEAQLLYGTLLRITGNLPEAEKTLVKANTLAKKANGDVHWQLALLYNRQNRNQDTIDELETYLKLVPDTPDKSKIQEMISKLKATKNKK